MAQRQRQIPHAEGGKMNEQQKLDLFLAQKQTLDLFLENGAITQAQYDKSYGDLKEKMGIEYDE